MQSFCCTGNICRSLTGEGLLLSILSEMNIER
jgi:protein-tyrosine-phosphatase